MRTNQLGDITALETLFHKLHPEPAEAFLLERMREKLAENSHKKEAFLACDLQFLSMRITQEKGELIQAVQEGLSVDKVWREAADVANFAAMVAVNYELQQAVLSENIEQDRKS